ncbi:putative male-specific lethal 3-like isoform X1 [Apostichopus japonicus]|uniref:Putative male-specific lethal 3-like isoform X1 n=1 Tax=Stichopus japonicus TaxID=307972 RepID=A0A2G8LQK9_STIJA|nr:putative male-specific lethal 3-like isoform X1 [Apostichopus japonicus]
MSGIILTRGVIRRSMKSARGFFCFEPDPTKVKVLYDAKILDVKWTRNEAGKRVPEYLVHFNGWNRSWDRWAPEDFVMKHSAENAELQWRLQMEAEEKALKGKKKKRKPGEGIDTGGKRQFISDSISGDGESEDSSVSEGNPVDELCLDIDDDMEEIPIQIPESLKSRLENDCYNVNCLDQLVRLPCEPTALSILEEYLQYFGVRHPEVDTQPVLGTAIEAVVPPPLPHQNFRVCREFLDGIRVLFDFFIFENLLYEAEKEQYLLHVTNPQNQIYGTQRRRREAGAASRDSPPRRMTRRLSAINSKAELASTKSDQERQEARRRPAVRHSRRIASLSSLPSTPSCSPPAIAMEAPEFPSSPSILVMEESTKEDSPTRSQPKDIPAPTEEVKDTPSEESEKQLHPLLENLKLLTKDAHYDGRIPPCKVYGGIHLLRLFVKLPEVIGKMNLPPKKQKPLQKHAELFLRFLSQESENFAFFPEGMYVSSKQALKGL